MLFKTDDMQMMIGDAVCRAIGVGRWEVWVGVGTWMSTAW